MYAACLLKLRRTYQFIFLFVIITFQTNISLAQDYQKMIEISDSMMIVLAELDSCKNDLDCIQKVSAKIEKLNNELEAAQNSPPGNQSTNIPDPNNQTVEPPNIPVPPNIGQQPPDNSKQNIPPPFESISRLYFEHVVASNPKPNESADCYRINETREKLLREISKVYDNNEKITPWQYPITISYCSEAKVVIEEQGETKIPLGMELKYDLRIEESPSWIATYEVFFDEENFRFGDKLYFKLWPAPTSATVIGNHSGWILDSSVDPPRPIPLDQVSLLSEKGQDKVWEYGFGGGEIIYTSISPAGSNSKGEITDYMLWLHNEPIRFYPNGKPEYYIEGSRGTLFEKLSKEDILSALKQGEYNSIYNETDITGTSHVTKRLTITFETSKCDSAGSGKGAIVLSGDCLDHGGHVIASKSGIYVNNKQVVFIGDDAMCKQHGMTKIIATKKINVLDGNRQIARIGDKTECGATIIGGSKNTFAGIK